ncbi:MAG TPA: alpha/beta hydrolase [Baekduia sp.]|nr:alpha/beta hydrolase [Baekduia sp.]
MLTTSGRAQIAYDVTGAADGPAVLQIHAGVNDRRSWAHVVEHLAPRYRCIAYDTRGYGETTYEPEDGWSPMTDALAVLDACGAERAIVVACSMGGQNAVDLALAHPERVAALVLIGSAFRGAPWPDITEGPTAEVNRLMEAADAAGDLDEVNRLDAWMWLDGPAEEGRVSGPARELFLDMNGRALRAEDPGRQAELPAAWPRLGEIARPTLILCGRLDCDDIKPINEHAAMLIPGARLRWLEGVAHVPHLEADRVTLDAIEAFVDEVAAPRVAG